MALYRRLSPRGNNDGQENSPKHPITKQPKIKHKLLTHSEVPLWCSHNPFLLTGFRPITGSVQLCVESLGYVHNETVNMYSHLVPAVITLTRAAFIHLYLRAHYPNALWADLLAFYLHLGVSTFCFAMSTAYHVFLCHSELYADFWGRLDYLAILLQLIGSMMSGTYLGFYCEQRLRRIYWTMVGLTPDIICKCPETNHGRLTDWHSWAAVNHCCLTVSISGQGVEAASARCLSCDCYPSIYPSFLFPYHRSIWPSDFTDWLALLCD